MKSIEKMIKNLPFKFFSFFRILSIQKIPFIYPKRYQEKSPLEKSPLGKKPPEKNPLEKVPPEKSPLGKLSPGKKPPEKSPLGKFPPGKKPPGKKLSENSVSKVFLKIFLKKRVCTKQFSIWDKKSNTSAAKISDLLNSLF